MRSAILLTAGLETTLKLFQSFEIWKFSKKSRIDLGVLSTEAECAAIRDWLKMDGGA